MIRAPTALRRRVACCKLQWEITASTLGMPHVHRISPQPKSGAAMPVRPAVTGAPIYTSKSRPSKRCAKGAVSLTMITACCPLQARMGIHSLHPKAFHRYIAAAPQHQSGAAAPA